MAGILNRIAGKLCRLQATAGAVSDRAAFAIEWNKARSETAPTAKDGEFMPERKPITSHLYFWVLLAIFAGVVIGHFNPAFAVKLKPLGDGFIALVKMMIGPIIFCTVVLGIAGAGDMKKVGRVGGKALLYFEVVSTLALGIGLLVMNLIRPGSGFNVDPKTLDAKAVETYAKSAANQTATDFVLHLIPKTFTDAFTGSGDLLQVL